MAPRGLSIRTAVFLPLAHAHFFSSISRSHPIDPLSASFEHSIQLRTWRTPTSWWTWAVYVFGPVLRARQPNGTANHDGEMPAVCRIRPAAGVIAGRAPPGFPVDCFPPEWSRHLLPRSFTAQIRGWPIPTLRYGYSATRRCLPMHCLGRRDDWSSFGRRIPFRDSADPMVI